MGDLADMVRVLEGDYDRQVEKAERLAAERADMDRQLMEANWRIKNPGENTRAVTEVAETWRAVAQRLYMSLMCWGPERLGSEELDSALNGLFEKVRPEATERASTEGTPEDSSKGARLETEANPLRHENAELKKRNAILRGDVAVLENERHELADEVRELKEQREAFGEELARAQDRIVELEKLPVGDAEMERLRRQVASYLTEIENLERIIHHRDAEINELKDYRRQIEQANLGLKARLEALERQQGRDNGDAQSEVVIE